MDIILVNVCNSWWWMSNSGRVLWLQAKFDKHLGIPACIFVSLIKFFLATTDPFRSQPPNCPAPKIIIVYRRSGFNCEYLLIANCEFFYVSQLHKSSYSITLKTETLLYRSRSFTRCCIHSFPGGCWSKGTDRMISESPGSMMERVLTRKYLPQAVPRATLSPE